MVHYFRRRCPKAQVPQQQMSQAHFASSRCFFHTICGLVILVANSIRSQKLLLIALRRPLHPKAQFRFILISLFRRHILRQSRKALRSKSSLSSSLYKNSQYQQEACPDIPTSIVQTATPAAEYAESNHVLPLP